MAKYTYLPTYFPKNYIVINVFNAKIAIASYFGTSNKFYTRLRCSLHVFLFSPDLQRRNLFLKLDLVIISLLISFVK